MFLSGILLVLFLAGCWLYCLTDAALTPASAFPGLPKRVWVALIAVTVVPGTVAWIITRYVVGPKWTIEELLAAEALARHPASRSRQAVPRAPTGPDDDPEFLRQLAERVRDGY